MSDRVARAAALAFLDREHRCEKGKLLLEYLAPVYGPSGQSGQKPELGSAGAHSGPSLKCDERSFQFRQYMRRINAAVLPFYTGANPFLLETFLAAAGVFQIIDASMLYVTLPLQEKGRQIIAAMGALQFCIGDGTGILFPRNRYYGRELGLNRGGRSEMEISFA